MGSLTTATWPDSGRGWSCRVGQAHRGAIGLALTVALLGTRPAQGQQAGLLLGFANADSSSVLWLTRSDGRFRVLRLGGMLVPRADGLWRIGTDSVPMRAPDRAGGVPRDSSEAGVHLPMALWAAPVGRAPLLAPPDSGRLGRPVRHAEGTRRELALTFVGPEYLAIDDQLTVEPRFSSSAFLIGRLDTLAARGYLHRAAAAPYDNLGGHPRDSRLTPAFLGRHAAWCLKRSHPSFWDEAPGASDTAALHQSWGIVRESGHWRYLRRFSLDSVGRWDGYDCRVPFLPPQSIVGADELRPGWPVVAKRVGGARDAFSSPDGQLMVVLTDTALNVYRLKGSRIGRLLYRTTAPAQPVVQARWASGAEAARWNRELQAVPSRASAPAARRVEQP